MTISSFSLNWFNLTFYYATEDVLINIIILILICSHYLVLNNNPYIACVTYPHFPKGVTVDEKATITFLRSCNKQREEPGSI